MSASFFTKKELLPPKRICLRLKELRLSKKISLEEIEKKTLVDKKYLTALEECQFEKLPSAVIYQKNFVKSYVEALGVDPEPFLAQYVSEEVVRKNKKNNKNVVSNLMVLNQLPLLLRYIFLFLAIFLVAFYLGRQVKRIVDPPKLVIFSPVEGYTTSENKILLTGETEKEVQITLNGQEIKNSEKGQFKEEVGLSEGVNTFVITAKKKHGKTITETRHVVYKVDS